MFGGGVVFVSRPYVFLGANWVSICLRIGVEIERLVNVSLDTLSHSILRHDTKPGLVLASARSPTEVSYEGVSSASRLGGGGIRVRVKVRVKVRVRVRVTG